MCCFCTCSFRCQAWQNVAVLTFTKWQKDTVPKNKCLIMWCVVFSWGFVIGFADFALVAMHETKFLFAVCLIAIQVPPACLYLWRDAFPINHAADSTFFINIELPRMASTLHIGNTALLVIWRILNCGPLKKIYHTLTCTGGLKARSFVCVCAYIDIDVIFVLATIVDKIEKHFKGWKVMAKLLIRTFSCRPLWRLTTFSFTVNILLQM